MTQIAFKQNMVPLQYEKSYCMEQAAWKQATASG